MSDYAPIVLFVYNRLNHTKQTIEALKKNLKADQSELYIYSDGAKDKDNFEKVTLVRNYINNIDGFKNIKIIEREENFGLAKSIIDGVGKVLDLHEKIIVLEDDLVTSPYFLSYMNEALIMYKDEPKVASIHGYIYPIEGLPDSFFIKGADCWGWATWQEKWTIFETDGKKLLNELKKRNLQKEADFNNSYGYTKMLENQINGNNNSWAVRWYISAFLKDMLTLYPGQSFVQNIGLDAEGTHCKKETDLYEISLKYQFELSKIDVKEDLKSKKKIENYFKKSQGSLYKKLASKINNLIK